MQTQVLCKLGERLQLILIQLSWKRLRLLEELPELAPWKRNMEMSVERSAGGYLLSCG